MVFDSLHKILKDHCGWRKFSEMCRIVDLKINTNFRDILLCALFIFIHNKQGFICTAHSHGFSRGLTHYSLCVRNLSFYKTQVNFSVQRVKGQKKCGRSY
jgi:hypothetical protein